jgi:hypothetical protein
LSISDLRERLRRQRLNPAFRNPAADRFEGLFLQRFHRRQCSRERAEFAQGAQVALRPH